jgi:signal transduction histidine kinase/DNA-binding response OmpR family regulator
MSEQTFTNISTFESRQLTFYRVLMYLVTGMAYLFGILNLVTNRPVEVAVYNLAFAVAFTLVLIFGRYLPKLTQFVIAGVLFQAFIFGHAYFILPGKQLEMGIGVMTCILPVLFEKKWLWFFFTTNFILYHLGVTSFDIETTFLFQYIFFIVVFIFIYALVKENRKYEQELIQQREKIAQDAQSLKELDELKNRFFANISHELRTPLTLILSPMDTILESNELSMRNQTYLRLMQQNGNKLLKRINELLELSRLDAKRLKIEKSPVQITSFITQIIASYEGSASLKDIKIQFNNNINTDKVLHLDASKLEMIISNYLSNAIKFTPQKGTITVHLSKQHHQLQISVQDTGVGIPSDELENVFQRFYQVNSGDYHSGSGIGLSICKELAELQNGKVWVTSEVGKGSMFYLQLPFVETFTNIANIQEKEVKTISEIQEKTSNISPAEISKPQILVVEDNHDLRQYLQLILYDKYQVILAGNGKEALEKLATRNPQLVVSDIMMPIMNGLELLKSIKRNDQLRHLPVILLTAQKHNDVKIEALRIGVDDYLTKPFKNDELIARVDNLVQNSQKRQELQQPTNKKMTSISQEDIEWLKSIEQTILQNVTNSQFKINDLAEQFHITTRTLQTKIKTITGNTPKQYQRSIQFHYARRILKNREIKSVVELSRQLGFEDQHYFSKIYKQQFGVSPKEELKAVSDDF